MTRTIEEVTDKERTDVTHPSDPERPESHPVGSGVGGLAGGATGAAIGAAVGGPVGAMVGGIVGGVAGVFAGQGLAEEINPAAEDEYWRETYSSRPYADRERPYEHFQPAYRYGWEARARHADRPWEEVEPELASGWAAARGDCDLPWERARAATRDAWDRLQVRRPTEAEVSGR